MRSKPVIALTLCLFTLAAGPVWSDDPENNNEEEAPVFELKKDVSKELLPLFKAISTAKASRAQVQLSVDSIVDGIVKNTTKSTYQIASSFPNKFTVYYKEPEQRTRVYCDGKRFTVALAPDAYLKNSKAISTKQAVTDMPIALGPYPEVVYALTFAGSDPVASFLGAMKSVEIVDRGKFRGKTPSVHLRGVQGDDVTWDFWISSETRKPLRLMVDLTPMLVATGQLQAPRGFTYLMRYDFVSWRISGTVDDALFDYRPSKDATEYESVDKYYDAVSEAVAKYPLLGKKAPSFSATLPNGKRIQTGELDDKVLVVDFWATWCKPCVNSIPIIQEVTDKYADKGVVFFPVNVGEDIDRVKAFLKKQGWDIAVVLDTETKISSGFAAEAIPLTVVIGKDGVVESAHVGFAGEDALRQRLSDELDVLCKGGHVETAPQRKK